MPIQLRCPKIECVDGGTGLTVNVFLEADKGPLLTAEHILGTVNSIWPHPKKERPRPPVVIKTNTLENLAYLIHVLVEAGYIVVEKYTPLPPCDCCP